MRTLCCLTCAILIGTLSTLAAAQTIDAGRGEIPLRVPAGYDQATPAPLVVLLHGYTSSGKGQESYMKFGEIADEYGYFLLAPDGTQETGGRNARFWNASDACCNFYESTIDDSAYIKSLIDKVKADYAVDPKRVFLIGHSNGGYMSYRVARDHSDTIAAFTSLAGATSADSSLATPAHPVNCLQIHGTDDTTIAYEGGEIQGTAYPSAKDSVLQWAKYNGCGPEATIPTETIDLDRKLEGNETKITRYTTGCKPGSAAELWTIQGGSHIPRISNTFTKHVIEWLYAHPKP